MKSTAKQEHNLNLKRDSYIPKMCVDPCAVGSTTITCKISCTSFRVTNFTFRSLTEMICRLWWIHFVLLLNKYMMTYKH